MATTKININDSNNLSALAATTSAQLAGVISDETGTGILVFNDTPTLITPVLGVASATSINKVALTTPATAATITVANNKTLTVSNTLTFTGTDSSSVNFGTGGTVSYSSGSFMCMEPCFIASVGAFSTSETGFTGAGTGGTTTVASCIRGINPTNGSCTLHVFVNSGNQGAGNNLVITYYTLTSGGDAFIFATSRNALCTIDGNTVASYTPPTEPPASAGSKTFSPGSAFAVTFRTLGGWTGGTIGVWVTSP